MTWRAVLVSIVVVAITAPAIFYGEVVFARRGQSVFWSSGVPAPWPLTVLFLLTAISSIPALGRLRLTRQELLTIYSVVLVVTPLFGIHVLFYVLSKGPSFYHMARSQPIWGSAFINLVPTWWGPSSLSAVEGYFLGGGAVPWSEWLLPLAAWGSFIFALYLANVCLLVLVQRQWVRHERLTFPLAQIPLETVREAADGGQPGRLPINKAFWIGLAIAATVGFLSQLSLRLPSVPPLPMEYTVMSGPVVGPLSAVGNVQIWLHPWLISLAYIIPAELSFSVWVFWLLRIGLCALAVAFGAEPGSAEDWWRWSFPAPTNQATGALVALSLWALWTARRHIARALRVAFSRRPSSEDSDEPLTYRWAFLGLAVCSSWLVAFFVLSGCRFSFGLAYVALLVGLYLAYARLQAEGALDPFFWWFNDIAAMGVGMRNLLPQETLALYTMNWAGAPLPSRIFSACSLNTLTSFKIADADGTNQRRLAQLLAAAFAVALALGMFVTLTAMYHHGFSRTSAAKGDYFVTWALLEDGYAMWHDITDEEGWQLGAVLYMVAGGVVTVFFGLMRLRFVWWPFHPIGYLLANSIPQAMGTFPFLIAWISKVVVTRYGGLRLYRATIPLAIGLIVGDLLNSSLWSIVTLVSRGRF